MLNKKTLLFLSSSLMGMISFNSFSYEITITKSAVKEQKKIICVNDRSLSDKFITDGVFKNFKYIKNVDIKKGFANDCSDSFTFYDDSENYYVSYEKDKSITKTEKLKSYASASNFLSDFIYNKTLNERSFFMDTLSYVEKDNDYYKIIVSNFDDSDKKVVLASKYPIMSPRVSPDGKYLSYISFEKVRPAIYLQSSDKRQLISNFKGINGFPSFSSDSKNLLFSLSKDNKNGYSDIYIYNIEKKYADKFLSLSGNQIYPILDNNDLFYVNDGSGNPKVYKTNVATKKTNLIFKDKRYLLSPSYSDKYISALFLENKTYGIVIYDKETGKEKVIKNGKTIESPSISKNGKLIVYSTKVNGKSVLNFVDDEGNNLYRIKSESNLTEPNLN